MPDFGIFRGFNEKLFGDKLVAGQLPTELGFIGSADFSTDVDALAFFARVTTAGGTLSDIEKLAIDTLVRQMKDDNIWTKMKAIYPMVGASAAACAQNLKSSSFTGTFNGGWTFANTGVTPNGTSAYMDTGVNPNSSLQLNSVHFSNYFPSFTIEEKCQIGVIDGSDGLYSFWRYNTSNAFHRLNSNTEALPRSAHGASGFNIATRTSSSSNSAYVNNVEIATSTTASSALPNYNMFISARNVSGAAGSFSSLEQSFASIGDGLTSTEASDFYTAVQAFQTTLSREV